jgi:predicted ATPase
MIPRIRQIQITHYKSIDRAVVDLEPFTVLVGPNGAGKSNFLDVLAFVQDCLLNPVEIACRNHGGLDIFSRWSTPQSENLPIGIRLFIDLPDDSTADYAFQIEGDWRVPYQVTREKCFILSRGRQRASFEISGGQFLQEIPGIRPQLSPDRLALSTASAAEEFNPLFDFLLGMKFYSIEPGRIDSLPSSVPSETLEFDGRNAAAVLKAIQDRKPETHARIERLISTAVAGIRGVTAYTSGQKLFFDFSMEVGQDKPVSLFGSSMSDGTLRILGLLLAIYQLKKPTVLAIEEPESTIHPAAAELITQVLGSAARDRQVLITTHSPDILDSKEIRDDQIRVVTLEQGRTIIAPMSKASRQAVRERLYTPGELLRIDELGQDVEEAKRAAESLEIFAAPSSSNL